MKYSEERIIQICKYLRKGITITTTCELVGIHRDTFYEWLKDKSDFSDTIKKVMAIPDRRVENALFKMAIGSIKYKEKQFEAIKVKDKISENVLVKTVEKTLAPNVTAQIFWLKNRKSTEWKDRHELEHSGGMTITVISAVPRPKRRGRNNAKKKKNKKG